MCSPKEISEQPKEWRGSAASKGDPTPSNGNEDSLEGNRTADMAEAEKTGMKTWQVEDGGEDNSSRPGSEQERRPDEELLDRVLEGEGSRLTELKGGREAKRQVN